MKISILGSGKGSNAKYILSEFAKGKLNKVNKISIFSDNVASNFSQLSLEFGCYFKQIPTDEKTSIIKDNYEKEWIKSISNVKPDLIVLAGFMKVVGINFIKHFKGQIINLHPSLLPKFKGLNAIKKAHDSGIATTGCTVHWVNETIDGGEIIAQSTVERLKSDSLEDLTSKIHRKEHFLLSQVICALAETQKIDS